VRFELDPAGSLLDIRGSVTKPIRAPVELVSNGGRTGLAGALFAEFLMEGGCPETFAELLQGAEGVKFKALPGGYDEYSGGIEAYPRQLGLAVNIGSVSLADLSLVDTEVSFNGPPEKGVYAPLEVRALPPADLPVENATALDMLGALEAATVVAMSENQPNSTEVGAQPDLPPVTAAFDVRVDGAIAKSSSVVDSPLTGPDPVGFEMAGLGASANFTGFFESVPENPREGRVVVNSVDFPFFLEDGVIAKDVQANVTFTASLEGAGLLGCSEECLLRGRCGTDIGSGDAVCQCECGFTGPDCSLAAGVCSAFERGSPSSGLGDDAFPDSILAQLVSNGFSVVNGSIVAPPTQESENALGSCKKERECSNGLGWDVETCSCSCVDGWAGTNCNVCVTDDACVAAGKGASCDRGLAVTNTTLEKTYFCELAQDDKLKEMLEGDIQASCDILAGECQLRFGSFTEKEGHFLCKASQCAFEYGSNSTACEDLSCECSAEAGCPSYFTQDVVDVILKAEGPMGVNCESRADGRFYCSLDMEGLPVHLGGLCVPGTCTYGNGTSGIEYMGPRKEGPSMMLIAMVTIVAGTVSLVLIFFGGSYLWRQRMMAVLKSHGKLGQDAVMNVLLPGRMFAFQSVSCAISSKEKEAPPTTTAGALKDALNRAASAPFGALTRRASKAVSEKVGSGKISAGDLSESDVSFAELPSPGSGRAELSPGSNRTAMSNHSLAPQAGSHSVDLRHLKKIFHSKSGKKKILNNISGVLTQGNVMAIMGPSGGGKSTLLNILAGVAVNFDRLKVNGSITVDGQARGAWFPRIAAHVPQEDNQIPTLTVRECIMYSALLRLPWHWTQEMKQRRVDEVLLELGMDHVANSKVGGSAGIRGVSGGERRRVSIGMELVTNPKILFLDEPTSGLDSHTAASIMGTLTKLARNGRMVFVSIHQPSETIFRQLDQVLLLSKGSKVFCGPPAEIETFFTECGFPCPHLANIADHILDVVSCKASVELIKKQSKNLNRSSGPDGNFWSRETEEDDDNTPWSPHTEALMNLTPHTKEELVDADAHQPLDSELLILFWRTVTDTIRHPALLRLHLAVSVLLGVTTAAIFANVPDNLAGVQNRAGCLFFTLTFFAFGSMTSIDLFMSERAVFSREQRGKYYRVGTYFISKALLDGLLLRVMPAVLYGVIVYWLVGMRPSAGNVAVFFLTLSLFNLAAGALSMVLTICSPSAGVAGLVTIVVLLISLLFGGFLANIDTIPVWLGWLRFLSIFYYAYEILIVNEIEGLNVNFDAASLDVDVKGDLFLDVFDFNADNLPRDIGALFAMYVGLLLLAYVLLWGLHSSSVATVKPLTQTTSPAASGRRPKAGGK
jgi:ABC-type multidrug transport system ATPase subunit